MEKNIATAANVPFEDVVVYCPSSQMQLKEATVPAYASRGRVVSLIDLKGDDSQEADLYYENLAAVDILCFLVWRP